MVLKKVAAIASLTLAPATVEESMAWKKPRVVEVSLGLEINAYACAELG
jgi:coenzyme PQQ precursor peptide PqqA